MRGELLGNILLVGGSSRFPGIEDRLQHEVAQLSPWIAPGKKQEDVHVHAPADRHLIGWRGAADLAECDVVKELWTSRSQYESQGAHTIHRHFI